jgi:MurNAc alpha-1-phosphate uridylyltransferase|tara:strand:- start:1083 stop:1775 length:693 start_codon:yes stop_codon:yes gene_type:complete
MKVKTALILCAGLGKRLKPLTLEQPKPLLKLNNITLLENTINLIKELGIKKILLNTYHLKNKIKNYLRNNKFDISIEIIDDGEQILDTGGGIMNMINSSNEKSFLIFNPDTIWDLNYLERIKQMDDFFKNSKIKNILLVVNKKLSFDKQLKGDFNLQDNRLTKRKNNDYIYTGCQIFSRDLLNFNKKKIFSVIEIWNGLIKKNNLFGFESNNKFFHVSNLEVYNKLLKDN